MDNKYESDLGLLLISGGDPERAKQKLGWALLKCGDSRSWLGGNPIAPATFVWPRSSDSKPQFFIGQIDLEEVDLEGVSGNRPQGLQPNGTLLFFASFVENKGMSYTCNKFSPAEMLSAIEHRPPTDIEPLGKTGFYMRRGDVAFVKRFVRPTPFESVGDEEGESVFSGESGTHRLLGLEMPFHANWDDLRGKDCLLSVGGDRELGTSLESHSGFSIWCTRDDLAAGEYGRGEMILHSSG